MNYYYLVSSLSELAVDTEPKGFDLGGIIGFCSEELKSQDYEGLKQLFLFNDIRNIIYFHEEDYQFLTPSYYSKEDIEEYQKDPDQFLPFISEYYELRKQDKRLYQQMNFEDELTSLFYQHLDSMTDSDFIKAYYEAELNLRNFTTAFSYRKKNQNYDHKIIPYGDYYETVIKSSAPDFGLSNEFTYLDKLIERFRDPDLIEREREIDEIRFSILDEMTGGDSFSLDFVYSYVIKSLSVSRWLKLKPETGKEILNTLVEEIKNNIKFSDEFQIIGGKR